MNYGLNKDMFYLPPPPPPEKEPEPRDNLYI